MDRYVRPQLGEFRASRCTAGAAMRGSARDVASSLTRLNTTNQTEPPYILSYKGGNRETPVLSLCVSPLPSLARVGGCAVWSAARSSAIVGVLQAQRGLSDITDNYCASRIGRASADDLHHSAAWPMMARHRAPCANDEVLHRTGPSAEVAGFSAPLLVESGPC